MSNQLISGEYFYKGRINYFLVKCHIYQGNKQIYNIRIYAADTLSSNQNRVDHRKWNFNVIFTPAHL